MPESNVINFSQVKVARRENALRELVRLTEVILDSAEQGNWTKAVDEQRQRRQLLENFFAETTVPDEADTVARAIQYMLDVDARVTEIVYSQRQQLLDTATRSQKSNQAAQAYLQHSE